MTLDRRTFVGLLLLGGAGCSSRRGQPAVRRAARYLWDHQAEDGGWHSKTYGLLESGQSLTPFVVDALLEEPAPPAAKVERAFDFLKRHTNSEGALGCDDPALADYPNYATALAVTALCRARRRQLVAPMIEYLRSQQFTEQNGWRRDDAPYGAWGMGGKRHMAPHPGHVDLSMSRYVLEALAAAGVPPADPALQKARVFIERCGGVDGGFFFTTVVLDANKAGREGGGYRSYGTTTADGILALLATGASPDDERVRAAGRWLVEHHRTDAVPGFVGEGRQRWARGLWFYYAAASTEAFRRLGIVPRERFSGALEATQRPDGSWTNEEKLVKEDDPLIATGFALRALLTPGS